MDTFKLKVLAIIIMLIDHIGAIFISPYTNYWLYFACRGIGRLAFPIFVFLIVEGFYHTSDVKKYLKRLGLFALISEIPFDLAFYKYHTGLSIITEISKIINDDAYFSVVLSRLNKAQNVFFTLFLGLLLITLMDMVDKKYKKNNLSEIIISNSIDGALTIAFCTLAYVMRTDYHIAGILMIVAFYLFRGSKSILGISVFIITGTILSNFHNFRETGNLYAIISTLATLAIIPIGFYNGEKGKSMKYFFYIFYPAHLLCLFLIALIV